MTEEQAFVETAVAHQVGDLADVTLKMDDATISHARKALSGMSLEWDNTLGQPAAHNGWALRRKRLVKTGTKVNMQKTGGALHGVLDCAPTFSFFVDMADHRARSLLTADRTAAPTFCFNRPINKPEGKILWPLAQYQDLGTNDFLGPDTLRDVPWDDKFSKVVWRGSAGGWARLGKYGRGRMIRMHALLNQNAAGDISDEETQRAMMTVYRHRFVASRQADPMYDLGYTQFGVHDIASYPMLKDLRRDRIPQFEQTQFKYLAVLPGADIGSNFFWVMNSSSLGIVQHTPFESFASVHFKPWVHYLPVRADLRDLDANLAWAEAHPDECQDMIKRANAVCDLLADEALRAQILGKVVATVGANIC